MTDTIIRQMLECLDVSLLDENEQSRYLKLRNKGFSKITSLLKLIYHHRLVSDELKELRDFILEYEKTLKIDE